MSAQDSVRRTGDFLRNSVTGKILSIGILILILLIPISMVSSLLHERESRRDSVVQEINQKWGNKQTITGPFFTVPYKSYYKNDKGVLRYNTKQLHILPENLNITGEIHPEVRYRSLYEAVLYNAKIKVAGNFIIPLLEQENISKENVLWDKAMFSIGISDMRGIKENINISFNEKNHKADPGLTTTDIVSSGLHSSVPLTPAKKDNTFSFQLNLNGSEQIRFIPLGETTTLDLKSSWPSPSFNGAYLPTSREVNNDGFSAEWKILHLNRNYPQFWTGNKHKVHQSSFGLDLIITADIYQKSTRISKYAIMFILFTFSSFFFAEIINKKRVHPIQYTLIGLAVILFYVLLLSISEHINFDAAYVISATAITTLITVYSRGVIKNNHFTVTTLGILASLYTYLYIVLQLEDYALIMGSLGLLFVLSTVMYITREIDWYALEENQD